MIENKVLKIFGSPIYMAHSLISEDEINELTEECSVLKKTIERGEKTGIVMFIIL